jgi:hypothetical protein
MRMNWGGKIGPITLEAIAAAQEATKAKKGTVFLTRFHRLPRDWRASLFLAVTTGFEDGCFKYQLLTLKRTKYVHRAILQVGRRHSWARFVPKSM